MTNLEITRSQLFQGCVISSIAHAIWSRNYPFAKFWHYWDGNYCHFNNLEGDFASISFCQDETVGVVFKKDHFQKKSLVTYQKCLEETLDIIPPIKKNIVEETIQYFIQNIRGEEIPLITNIFWNSGNIMLTTVNKSDWEDFWLTFLNKQLMDFHSALLAFQDEYNLNAIEVDLLDYLAKKKIQTPNKIININPDKKMEKILCQDKSNITIDLLKNIGITVST